MDQLLEFFHLENDDDLKRIRNLVPNGTWNQWLRELYMPTQIVIKSSNQSLIQCYALRQRLYIVYLFNRLYELSQWVKPAFGTTKSARRNCGVNKRHRGIPCGLTDTDITNIVGEPTREALIYLHRLIIRNTASFASNPEGGRNGHPEITMKAEDYLYQTGHAFVPLHNPGNYPTETGTIQEQVTGTKSLRKNQALFRCCTAIGGAIKKQIVTELQHVLM